MGEVTKKRDRRAVFREEWTMGRLANMEPPYSVRRLADRLLVSPSTIYRWMEEHDAFATRVHELRGIADDAVEDNLFKRAVGYKEPVRTDEDGNPVPITKTVKKKVIVRDENGEPVLDENGEAVTVEEEVEVEWFEHKHVPPDVKAQQVWLRSRRPDEWRDTVKVEVTTRHTELMEHAMSVLDLDESDYEEIIR